MLIAIKLIGLKGKLTRTSSDRLPLTPLPALALLRNTSGGLSVVVLAQCDGQRVLFQDPSGAVQGGRPVIEPLGVFQEQWTGELILVTSRASLAGDLAKFDFSWFIPSLVKYRRQIGVVLQENWLFNRSVRENIAVTDPAAPIEAVIRAAQLAGAHEFVSELPEGYDTLVGEQGASLSGGQRQRIAIARALFTRRGHGRQRHHRGVRHR